MKADKMTIIFSSAREVHRFEANGSAVFAVTTEDNRHFNGEADNIVYLPKEGLYTLSGHAWIEDTTDKRKVVGEHIVLNELTKAIKVSGEDAVPVKLIFTVKDKNETVDSNATDR
jgi:lipopolysaccharide export system protein LptA